MRRGGTFAFIIYIVFTILTLGLVIAGYASTFDGALNNYDVILIVLAVSGIATAIPYVLLLFLKILHFASGIRFFGILCIIVNVVAIIATCGLFFVFLPMSYLYVMLVFLAMPLLLALFSEIRGLDA